MSKTLVCSFSTMMSFFSFILLGVFLHTASGNPLISEIVNGALSSTPLQTAWDNNNGLQSSNSKQSNWDNNGAQSSSPQETTWEKNALQSSKPQQSNWDNNGAQNSSPFETTWDNNNVLRSSSSQQTNWDNNGAQSSTPFQSGWDNNTVHGFLSDSPNSPETANQKTQIVQRSAEPNYRPQPPLLPSPLLQLPPLPVLPPLPPPKLPTLPPPRKPLARVARVPPPTLFPRDVNLGLGRALGAVSILSQIDSYISDRARAIARKLLLLIDDDSINRLPQEY